MKIGIPKEIKDNENRVGLTPQTARAFIEAGHDIYIESLAGVGSGFEDEAYQAIGAKIVTTEQAWATEMVIKVKEPIESEYHYLRSGLILYTYLHLAPNPGLTKVLIETGTIGVAYETIQLADRSLPLLTPMSEIAGRMSVQIGAALLESSHGGAGILLAGIPGVKRGKITILGGGTAGTNAAKIGVGIGADVTVLDVKAKRLQELDDIFGNSIQTLVSTPYNIAEQVKETNLLISTVLIPGAKTPILVSEEMVKSMKPGSVIVDIAIDQGGAVATMDHITTHADPTFSKYDVIHYAVANMPGAVAKTSTLALTNVTVPYALKIANQGFEKAVMNDKVLATGVNTYAGKITNQAVSDAQDLPYSPLETLLR